MPVYRVIPLRLQSIRPGFIKPSARKLFILCLPILVCNEAFSQKFLEVPVKLEVEKGNFDGVIVKVKKDGKDAFTQDGSGKLRFKLDYNKKYSLVFTKPGYITKTIEFNTSAPEARINTGFEPYKIGVKLFKQSDDENVVIYNQAVAKIKYDQTLDDFGFDTDYSKSILSAMNSPENDNKEPEDETIAEPPKPVAQNAGASSGNNAPSSASVNTPAGNSTPKQSENKPEEPEITSGNQTPVAQDQPGKTQPSGGESKSKPSSASGGSELNKTASVNGGESAKKSGKPETGSDSNRNSAPATGSDKNKSTLPQSSGEDKPAVFYASTGGLESQRPLKQITEEEKITMEEIVEKNRVITRVKISRGMKITEFSKVDYNWGATFYFKDNITSISGNFFVQATGITD